MKIESKKVEEEFLEEISGFNCNFSLGASGEEQSGSRKQTETMELDREVERLHRGAATSLFSAVNLKTTLKVKNSCVYFALLSEMELMSSSDCLLISVRDQKRRLQLELQGLDAVQTGEYRSFICCHVNVVKCKPTTSCI